MPSELPLNANGMISEQVSCPPPPPPHGCATDWQVPYCENENKLLTLITAIHGPSFIIIIMIIINIFIYW